MKNKTFYYLLLTIGFISIYACGGTKQATATKKINNSVDKVVDAAINEQFEQFKENFLSNYWKANPSHAAYVGLTDYDTLLILPTAENRAKQLANNATLLKELQLFKNKGLSLSNQTDYSLIENRLLSSQWYAKEFKSYAWQPNSYNLGGKFHRLLGNNDLPIAGRLEKIYILLEKVAPYYKAAQQNIDNPTVEHTQLAIGQLQGTVAVFQKNLTDAASAIDTLKALSFTKKAYLNRIDAAKQSVLKYIHWLEKDILPTLSGKTARSFRIGKELYNKKFAFDIQSGYTADEIYKKAIQEKKAIHEKMAKITTKLWPKYFETAAPEDNLVATKLLIDKIAQKHVARDSFVVAIKKQLPELVAFVKEKDLLYLDPAKPLEVRETPVYMRGVAGASISAPGPFEKSRPTYYNVTPLDHYSAEQAESYLREYNHYMLQILNIHEAIPGHYAQLVYSNQSPSLIKSIFGNGAMIEGWACYTERMMLEEGYGNHQPELWLMYYKWNLRIVCNTILDYSVHVLNMQEKEAIDLLTKEAFQEATEASGKWRRATLTQVQLCSYYTGLTEIYDFREERKKAQGKDFNLKAFHEQFLSYGSVPVKEIRKLMKK